MKSTRRNFLGAISGLSLVAASGTLWAQTAAKGKILVVFFSWSGNTRYIAQMIQNKTGADIVKIEMVMTYSENNST